MNILQQIWIKFTAVVWIFTTYMNKNLQQYQSIISIIFMTVQIVLIFLKWRTYGISYTSLLFFIYRNYNKNFTGRLSFLHTSLSSYMSYNIITKIFVFTLY